MLKYLRLKYNDGLGLLKMMWVTAEVKQDRPRKGKGHTEVRYIVHFTFVLWKNFSIIQNLKNMHTV